MEAIPLISFTLGLPLSLLLYLIKSCIRTLPGKRGELTRMLGSKLSPLMNGEYWKDHGVGKGLKEIITALPLIGETTINVATV